MSPALKLNSIDQEHLQELYDASGVARDELPYTEAFEHLWQGFQDRTFKNAQREQLYSALLKYVRSSGNASTELPATKLNEEQLKLLRVILVKHSKGGKVLPYSDEFEGAMKDLIKQAALVDLTPGEFWHAILRVNGAKRRPPTRKKAEKVEVEETAGGDDDVD